MKEYDALATQVTGTIMPIEKSKPAVEMVDVTDEMKEYDAYVTMRHARKESRVRSLTQLGFDFGRKTPTATPTDPWQRRLSELRGYKKREGHTDVPRNFDINLEL